ncbi:MAG: Ig-like domain-containing protein [Clostridiales bacterium]|nr:Ig-like domain-containing protein [Clostridiales bacterium]
MSDNAEKKTKPISQKKRIALFVLISTAAMLICIGVVIGVAFSLITDGVYEFPEDIKESKTQMPTDAVGMLMYLTDVTNSAFNNNIVYINTSVEAEIKKDSIECGENKNMLNLFKHYADGMDDSLDELYGEDFTGKFGDGFDDFWRIRLDPSDCISGECTEGRQNDHDETVDSDNYFINLKTKGQTTDDGEGDIYKTFHMSDDKKTIDKAFKLLEKAVTINDYSATVPDCFEIEAKINRFTDRPEYIVLKQTFHITLNITFKNELKSLGTQTVSFDYSVRKRCDYIWAGITCPETLTLQKGDNVSLDIKATLNDYSDYTVDFKTSNKKIATVDDLGYIEAISENEKPAIITVTLKYLGHEYTAKCEVFVRIPVEKIEISEKELEMKVGQSKELTAFIKPDDATDKDVIWLTDDREIVDVNKDEPGSTIITAKSVGTVIIRAVADDGHYQAICTVTVTE